MRSRNSQSAYYTTILPLVLWIGKICRRYASAEDGMAERMGPEELDVLRKLWEEYEAARQAGEPTDVIAAKIHAVVASAVPSPTAPSTHREQQQGARNE